MQFSFALPGDYRHADILRFHARDVEQLAERVEANRIWKGVTVNASPVVIGITLQKRRAVVEVDGAEAETVRVMAESMLALRLEPAAFEKAMCGDAMLGAIIQRQRGLRIPQTGTVFEAITWAVMGQQISVSFAVTLRRAFIRAAGVRHSSGLWCYPDAEATLRVSAEALGKLKFSRAKAETIVRIARMVKSGELPLESSAERSGSCSCGGGAVEDQGVGPWTAVHDAAGDWGGGLLFAACGDAAVRNNMALAAEFEGEDFD